MEDSIEVKVTTDDCITYTFELEFEATKGYISYDYFEPSEPDDVEIIGIKSHEYYVSETFSDILIENHSQLFYDKIWDHLHNGDY